MSKIVVDPEDNQIGSKERDDINEGDIYRISCLWVTNTSGDILLAQRKLDKKIEPGCWGPAVTGTVELGETYESNMIKEAEEEIGLNGKVFDKLRKMGPFELGGNYFVQTYTYQTNMNLEDFNIQESEVEDIRWFKAGGLRIMIENTPDKFVASAPFWESAGLL